MVCWDGWTMTHWGGMGGAGVPQVAQMNPEQGGVWNGLLVSSDDKNGW